MKTQSEIKFVSTAGGYVVMLAGRDIGATFRMPGSRMWAGTAADGYTCTADTRGSVASALMRHAADKATTEVKPTAAPSWEATVRATPAALAYDAADNAAETSPCSICEKPLGMGHHTCHDCISARHADHSGAVCQDCMRAAPVQATGYTSCACRDCMELAIGPTGAMCHACTEALCDAFYTECRSADAYGGEEIPPCAASMGCLCAAHACGAPVDSACDATEPQPEEETSMSTPPTTVEALTSDTGSDASPTYYAVAREHVDTCRALKWAWISIRPYVLAVDCDPATAHHLAVQRAGHDDVLVLRVGGNDPWSEVSL